MRGVRHHRRPWVARLVFALALVAALGRAAIPVGFMPTAEDGVLKVIICGAEGAAHVEVDLGGDDPQTDAGGGDHCVFAASSAAAPPVAVVSISAPLAALPSAASAPMRDVAPGRGLAAPPPPSHAPPILI